MTAVRAPELECEATIIATAKMFGWRVHGERAAMSRRGYRTPIKVHPGWPDLVLARPGRLLIVELKRKPNEGRSGSICWRLSRAWRAVSCGFRRSSMSCAGCWP